MIASELPTAPSWPSLPDIPSATDARQWAQDTFASVRGMIASELPTAPSGPWGLPAGDDNDNDGIESGDTCCGAESGGTSTSAADGPGTNISDAKADKQEPETDGSGSEIFDCADEGADEFWMWG